MKNISAYVSNLLGESGIISKEQVDICRYGIDYFIVSVSEILSVLIISLFVGNFVDTFIYFFAFIPLRIYAGGYHADSKLRCYIILLAVYAVVTVLIRIITDTVCMTLSIGTILLTLVMVYKFAPVIDDKKNVNSAEAAFYKKVSIIITLSESILIISGFLFTIGKRYIVSFTLGQLAVSLSMIAAFVKSFIKGGEH